MCKKTVIKRHAKLVPKSVDFNKASALEDRVHMGESQMDLLTEDAPGAMIEEETEPPAPTFDDLIPEGTDKEALAAFITRVAASSKITEDQVKAEAAKDAPKFFKMFAAWQTQERKKAEREAAKKTVESTQTQATEEKKSESGDIRCDSWCPIEKDAGRVVYQPKSVCDTCGSREGCPSWK
jgi:hypothetical protein